MKLYKRMIRPVFTYPSPKYETICEDSLEPKDVWYPEDEAQRLIDKYMYIENTFEHVIFEEKYVEVSIDEIKSNETQ